MKQLYIQAPTQHPKSIKDEFSVKNQSNIGRNSRRLAILNPKQPGGALGTDKHEWQGTGLCKGPPGRPRSPGMFPEHPPARLRWTDGPDGGTTPDRVWHPVGGNTPRNKEIQIFKNNKFNYYSQSNFTIMKKQILFLFVFLLTLSVSINSALAQKAVLGAAPRGTGCKDDALHPIAGKPYTYDVIPTPATGNTITWWATKDQNFVTLDVDGVTRLYNNTAAKALNTTSGDLINVDADYNKPTADKKSVQITWSDKILSGTSYKGVPAGGSPTFVATHVVGTCTDNLKVYELAPIVGFTVDILNYDITNLNAPLAYDATTKQCIDEVSKATYNNTAFTMEYEYGKNIFVYEVVAANFSDYYTPEFVLTGLQGTQTAKIEWTVDKPSTWGAATVFYDMAVAPTTKVSVDPTTDTSKGVSIYVRVTVTNNQFENNSKAHPTGVDLTLAVDGKNSVNQYDVDNGNGTTCDQTTIAAADQKDKAVQTLDPRPAVETHSPTSDYQAPNNIIIPEPTTVP